MPERHRVGSIGLLECDSSMAPPQLLNDPLSVERSLVQLLRPAQQKIEENEGMLCVPKPRPDTAFP